MRCILFYLLIIYSANINAQLIDAPLQKYKVQIYKELIKFGEIDSLRKFEDVVDVIYTTEINIPFKFPKTTYYEIGITTDHGYKYLGIIHKNNFTLLPTKSFEDDYNEIVNPFKNSKLVVQINFFVAFLSTIKEMYDYNLNPPWKKKY
jgi:hypothetical protein